MAGLGVGIVGTSYFWFHYIFDEDGDAEDALFGSGEKGCDVLFEARSGQKGCDQVINKSLDTNFESKQKPELKSQSLFAAHNNSDEMKGYRRFVHGISSYEGDGVLINMSSSAMANSTTVQAFNSTRGPPKDSSPVTTPSKTRGGQKDSSSFPRTLGAAFPPQVGMDEDDTAAAQEIINILRARSC